MHDRRQITKNKGKLIGGSICLALGILLTILTFALEEDQMMFTVGDKNAPIVPAIALIVVGAVLLSTAREKQPDDATAAMKQAEISQSSEAQQVNKRLETTGWGLFLIMLGGFSLVPTHVVASGVWSIGVGVIMIGLNVARYFYGIKLSGFTTFLGVISLFGGIAQLMGMDALEGALFFFLLSAYLILKLWFDKHQIFGRVA